MSNQDELKIEGFQSFKECKESILKLAKSIESDSTSYIANEMKRKSMLSLLELYSTYNLLLIEQEKSEQDTKSNTEEKTLHNSDISGTEKNVSDLVSVDNKDKWAKEKISPLIDNYGSGKH